MVVNIHRAIVCKLLVACLLVAFIVQHRLSTRAASAVASSVSARQTPRQRPIEDIRVGQRVVANNPELDFRQRKSMHEPIWSSWLRVRLELPLAAGQSPMQIELLRPEPWIRDRLEYLVQPNSEVSSSGLTACQADVGLRDIFADEMALHALASECGWNVCGRRLHLDLSEMGAAGWAEVKEIGACSEIASGSGSVVTGTFTNLACEPVLDVTFERSGVRYSVGVTATHPFWSVDESEFVPIARLPDGARLLGADGREFRIVSKLPRPGPEGRTEQVFNLEVFGEHVYCVGPSGIIVHNRCEIGDLGEKAAKGWLERHGYTDIHQFQNPSGHGIDVFARHRDGTYTFFEVKTSGGSKTAALSNAQKNPFKFITSRLSRAASAGAWWRKTPQAVRDKAFDLGADLRAGAKYRRYVIEITNAGNASAPTSIRILPWP